MCFVEEVVVVGAAVVEAPILRAHVPIDEDVLLHIAVLSEMLLYVQFAAAWPRFFSPLLSFWPGVSAWAANARSPGGSMSTHFWWLLWSLHLNLIVDLLELRSLGVEVVAEYLAWMCSWWAPPHRLVVVSVALRVMWFLGLLDKDLWL
jgi:hypothetical protein